MKRLAAQAREQSLRAQGISLVEILLAVLILGGGVVGITQGITASLRGSHTAEQYSTAVYLACGQMELTRADSFVYEGSDAGEFDAPFGKYRWESEIKSATLDGLYDVEVRVFHGEKESPIYALTSRLFDQPFSSILSDDETGTGAGTGRNPRDRDRDRRSRPTPPGGRLR
ncbi:MAG: hypothetical protein AAF517_27150 [Planctomycetota bacterium]